MLRIGKYKQKGIIHYVIMPYSSFKHFFFFEKKFFNEIQLFTSC